MVFYLSKERKARVWLKELPDVWYANNESSDHHRVAECLGTRRIIRSKVAVELFIPVGGRFLYGMLGGCAEGENSSKTTIEIADGASCKRIGASKDSLVDSLDRTMHWIDSDYFPSILEGAAAAAEEYEFLTKIFRFSTGKQSAIGSSPALFRRLAFIVVALLAVPEKDVEECLEDLVTRSADSILYSNK